MVEDRKKLVIVGGGTAGWLSALMVQHFARINGHAVDVTVVESSKIPTVGVGEGTTAVFRQLLLSLGLDESEFIRETGATLKLGIRHRDWKSVGHTYDGPIDDPHLVSINPDLDPIEQSSALDIYAISVGKSVADNHLFGQLMRRKKSPFARKKDGGLLPAGPFHHAYHFDQAKVGVWLRKQASGIERIDAQVKGTERKPGTDLIASIITDEDISIAGDFFIDCTGFRRKLICEELGARWISYADRLPVNRAMPFWLDHEADEDIAPYTLAWAQKAGWMWAIPTQDRMGCGYVYCDEFISPEEAQREIEMQLGRSIDPRNDIKFDIGRLDRNWIGNCLALGLSSSFLEPLEATSIHGTVVQLMLFTQEHFPSAFQAEQRERDRYNRSVTRQVDDFKRFINVHYRSHRQDAFWLHVQENCRDEDANELVKVWQASMPTRADFEPFPSGLPHVEEQLYYPVLDGLGLLGSKIAKQHLSAKPKVRAHARKTTANLEREYKKAAGMCMGHLEYLDWVCCAKESSSG